ncbi:unnamed protein product [Ectocarpus fasciculatus]
MRSKVLSCQRRPPPASTAARECFNLSMLGVPLSCRPSAERLGMIATGACGCACRVRFDNNHGTDVNVASLVKWFPLRVRSLRITSNRAPGGMDNSKRWYTRNWPGNSPPGSTLIAHNHGVPFVALMPNLSTC